MNFKSDKSNWAVVDQNGKLIKKGFRYKLAANREMKRLKLFKNDKLRVVEDTF